MMSVAGVMEGLHSCSHGSRRAQCTASSMAPARAGEAAHPGLEFTPVWQHLSLRTEGGVDVWRARDVSVERRQISSSQQRWGAGVGSQRLVGEIADSTAAVEGGVLEPAEIVDSAVSGEGRDVGSGFRFDFIQEIRDVTKQAETLKEDVMSLDYSFSPTPFTPLEGPEAFRFTIICAGLIFIFWLGNYFFPDQIFKDTVFKEETEDPPDLNGTSAPEAPEDSTGAGKVNEAADQILASNKEAPEDSTGAGKVNEAADQILASNKVGTSKKVGAGSGRSKQKRFKGARKK